MAGHNGDVERVIGVVQHYAWGDHDALPRLLGLEPDGRPWAELWFGSHRGGPATTTDGRPIDEVCGGLPYLLKVLAAAAPLSLQTHPDAQQARAGFDREERNGTALDDPRRTYRDPHAKPELICALTPFEALCGFRPTTATLPLLDELGLDELAAVSREHGLDRAVRDLYLGRLDLESIIERCAGSDRREARLLTALAERYPGDPSVAVTLLMHHVSLLPGEAIFLGPGNLHAYLHGVGVEVMGPSDNVVRGGLTVKHVDVDELLRVVRVEPVDDPRLTPTEMSPGRWCYDVPGAPFRLWRWDLDGTLAHTATGRELVVCIDGDAGPIDQGETLLLLPGDDVRLEGTATVFRVEEMSAAG